MAASDHRLMSKFVQLELLPLGRVLGVKLGTALEDVLFAQELYCSPFRDL